MDWVGSLVGLPSLLDGLLDSHVYRVVAWVQVNQKLLESRRISSSECLFLEGRTQEKQRFSNGFAIQRRAPRFTGCLTGWESMGKRRRYVVHNLYASLISLPTRSNLKRRWMLVMIVLLFVCLNMVLARPAHYRWWSCVLQSYRLRFSRFSWDWVG